MPPSGSIASESLERVLSAGAQTSWTTDIQRRATWGERTFFYGRLLCETPTISYKMFAYAMNRCAVAAVHGAFPFTNRRRLACRPLSIDVAAFALGTSTCIKICSHVLRESGVRRLGLGAPGARAITRVMR